MTEQRTAWGWGLASIDAAGNTLDVWYPELTLGEAPAETSRPNHNFGAIAHDEADARGVRRMPVFTVSKLDEPIEDAADAYLRLHLLSMRLAKPNTLNLDGIFAKLNNVVWTNYGPFAVVCRLHAHGYPVDSRFSEQSEIKILFRRVKRIDFNCRLATRRRKLPRRADNSAEPLRSQRRRGAAANINGVRSYVIFCRKNGNAVDERVGVDIRRAFVKAQRIKIAVGALAAAERYVNI